EAVQQRRGGALAKLETIERPQCPCGRGEAQRCHHLRLLQLAYDARGEERDTETGRDRPGDAFVAPYLYGASRLDPMAVDEPFGDLAGSRSLLAHEPGLLPENAWGQAAAPGQRIVRARREAHRIVAPVGRLDTL